MTRSYRKEERKGKQVEVPSKKTAPWPSNEADAALTGPVSQPLQ